MIGGINVRVQGRFKFVVSKGGKITKESEWTDNLVLDNGLRNMGNQRFAAFCRVGSGSSEPTKEQTRLDAQVAATSSYPEGIQNPSTGIDLAREFFWTRYNFRFNTGQAAGRLSEVGVGWASDGDTLFNRALLRDAKGQKVTIVVLEDETLDVFVEIRNYVSSAPVTHTMTAVVQGEDNTRRETEYSVKILPLYTAVAPNTVNNGVMLIKNNKGDISGYGSAIISTTTPPRSMIDAFEVQTQPYETPFERILEGYWGINQGNGVPLKTVLINTTIGTYQAEITPAFPKTPQYVLRLAFKISWGRYE